MIAEWSDTITWAATIIAWVVIALGIAQTTVYLLQLVLAAYALSRRPPVARSSLLWRRLGMARLRVGRRLWLRPVRRLGKSLGVPRLWLWLWLRCPDGHVRLRRLVGKSTVLARWSTSIDRNISARA